MSKRFPFGLPFGPGKFTESVNAVPKKEPVHTPFEVAQLSVSLALMKGEKQADIDGAIELLKRAALRLNEVKPAGPIWANSEKEAAILRVENPGVEVRSPKTHPEEARIKLDEAKDWPGSLKITPPKKFPATPAACWRALAGRRPDSKDRAKEMKNVVKANPRLARIVEVTCDSELDFWDWAARIARWHPRFAKDQKRIQKRSQKRKEGKYYALAQDIRGKIKKSAST